MIYMIVYAILRCITVVIVGMAVYYFIKKIS